jgi:hypothetical protein
MEKEKQDIPLPNQLNQNMVWLQETRAKRSKKKIRKQSLTKSKIYRHFTKEITSVDFSSFAPISSGNSYVIIAV